MLVELLRWKMPCSGSLIRCGIGSLYIPDLSRHIGLILGVLYYIPQLSSISGPKTVIYLSPEDCLAVIFLSTVTLLYLV